mgnify:CR=1 FL=1
MFEAKAILEKAKRVGGHKARIVVYHSALVPFIDKYVHVKVYTSNGRLVKEVDLRVARKVYKKNGKEYEYGKLSISLPTDYAGERMIVEVYPNIDNQFSYRGGTLRRGRRENSL